MAALVNSAFGGWSYEQFLAVTLVSALVSFVTTWTVHHSNHLFLIWVLFLISCGVVFLRG